MDEDVKKIQFRLPADVYRWLVVYSARNNRSMNGQLIETLREKMYGSTQKEAA